MLNTFGLTFFSSIIHKIVFFFQAEDGIRDYKVTGVQTCALPISFTRRIASISWRNHFKPIICAHLCHLWKNQEHNRSEERRVGKEGRSRMTQKKSRNKPEND